MRAEILAGLATATALALSITVGAQGGAPKEHTMSGCLQKGSEAGTFVVANTAEKGPKTIGITADSTVADLMKHVGHKIDITGVGVPNAEAESAAKKPAKADHYMKITAMKHVSPTCP
jgi:hypothetical protein